MKFHLLALCHFTVFFFSLLTHSAQTSAREISFHPISMEGYRNVHQPCVIADSCVIYATPEENSHVVKVLKFHDYLDVLGEAESVESIVTQDQSETGQIVQHITHLVHRWYKVEVNSITGYAQSENIALHTITEDQLHFTYFIVSDSLCRIFKFDEDRKTMSDTLMLENMRNDVIQIIPCNGWKNVNALFRISMINAYCGGGLYDAFIIDTPQNLSLLLQTQSSADDGSAESLSSTVWLPISFANKKILHVENGDVDHIFDAYAGNLKTKSLPKGALNNKEGLIIWEETVRHGLYDSNGDSIMDKDGQYKIGSTKSKTNYMRWTGQSLVPEKLKYK